MRSSLAARIARAEAHLAEREAAQLVSLDGVFWRLHAALAEQGIVLPPAKPQPHQQPRAAADTATGGRWGTLPWNKKAVVEAWTLASHLRRVPAAYRLPDSEARLLAYLRKTLQCPDLELEPLQEEALAIARTWPGRGALPYGRN
jgi:hypothetical protein